MERAFGQGALHHPPGASRLSWSRCNIQSSPCVDPSEVSLLGSMVLARDADATVGSGPIPNASADAIARLDEYDRFSTLPQPPRRGKACETSTHDAIVRSAIAP